DFRLSPEGKLYLLEANPNPQLAFGEDFAESAEHAGISYEQLLGRILNLGKRYRLVGQV
ncbi:MAG: D-alanine--D-alanine ligase, partial [Planctomycetota bacterium]